MNTIDALDERILAELQENGRLTMKALAERVGLSSPAMIERVRRLEERGVVVGYRALVNPAAIGRPLTAIIDASVDHNAHEQFLNHLASEPAVVECLRTTGAVPFHLRVHVANAAELEALVDRLSAIGAHCSADLVLSAPIAWREISPPSDQGGARRRTTRRRRATTFGGRLRTSGASALTSATRSDDE